MWSVPLSIDINVYRKNLEEAEVQKVTGPSFPARGRDRRDASHTYLKSVGGALWTTPTN